MGKDKLPLSLEEALSLCWRGKMPIANLYHAPSTLSIRTFMPCIHATLVMSLLLRISLSTPSVSAHLPFYMFCTAWLTAMQMNPWLICCLQPL